MVHTNRSSSLPQKTTDKRHTVSGAGSGLCELTNQSKLGIQQGEP